MTTYNLPNNSVVKVHDIFDALPVFMKRADVIFSDPPYNQALLSNFSNREKIKLSTNNTVLFPDFQKRFFECIDEIKPKKLFIEIGKQYKETFYSECEKRYSYVSIYESTYYHNKKNKCWIIVAEKEHRYYPFGGIDEEEVIKWICSNLEYECIGDLCMGMGLVGYHSFLNGKSFVGTELNKKRLAVLVDKINKKLKKGLE